MKNEDLLRALDYMDSKEFENERKSFAELIKSTIKIETISCTECILCGSDCDEGYLEFWCNHPQSKGFEITSSELEIIPAWCKLRTTNLTIRIKGE